MGAHQQTVFIKGEGGGVFELSLPLHETIEDQLRKGTSVRCNEDGSPYVIGSDGEPVTPAPPTERPADDADQTAWIGWAVVNGCTPDDAAAMTKQDLIDKYGKAGEPVTPAPPTKK